MFGPLKTKFTSFQIPDEREDIAALSAGLELARERISDLNLFSVGTFNTYSMLLSRTARPAQRFGYKVTPEFLLGAIRPRMTDEQYAGLQPFAPQRCEGVKLSSLHKMLANPDDSADDTILRMTGHKGVHCNLTYYAMDFIPAAILGRMYHAQGITALKNALRA
jgi:hypothetical protein